MASILRVGEKWRALVRRKGHAAQCKTFATKAQAQAWARDIENRLDAGQTLGDPRGLTVAQVVQAYRELRESSRPIADTSNEHYMLRRLADPALIGTRHAGALTPQDLVGYCTARREDGAGPYTCNMEVSKLGTVMRYAAVALRVTLPDVVGAARPLLSHLGLIGGGGKRERRPTDDELQRVVAWLASNKGAMFGDIVEFAVATTLRRGEIVRIQWADVDQVKRLVLVRDRKHPRRKIGNDEWVPLLASAWDVLQRQPRVDDEPRCFPITETTVSKYFTEACRVLAIPDLHFHDLRHDGTSRLFELGYAIQEVALATGHRDWRHLRRYTNLRPEQLHRPKEAPSKE